MTQTFAPGTPVVVLPHGMTITDAVITGTRPHDNADGFLYTYRRTSNGASGVILPKLVHLREG